MKRESVVNRRINALQFFSGMGSLLLCSLLLLSLLFYFYDLRFIFAITKIDEANLFTPIYYEFNLGIYKNTALTEGEVRRINLESLQKLQEIRLQLMTLGGGILFFFSLLYIKRLRDINLSFWISLLPLTLFFGAFIYFYLAVHEVILHLNFSAIELFELGKIVTLPSKEGWERLKPLISFILEESQEAYLVLGVMSLVIFLSALLFFSREDPNQYGHKPPVNVYQKVTGGVMIFLVLIVLYYFFATTLLRELLP